MVQYELLKDNPTTFSNTCMIAERISQLDNYLGELYLSIYIYKHLEYNSKHNCMQHNDPTSCALMEHNAESAT